MSLPLAPEIVSFLKTQSRVIKKDLTDAKSGILLQKGMPPSIIHGTIDGDSFTSKVTGSFTFTPGKGSDQGIVLPISILSKLLKTVRNVYLPGGSPIKDVEKELLGKDPETSNAGILVLPLLPKVEELDKISGILGIIPNNLGLSVLLVEYEPDGIQSVGSMLVEAHRFACELLEKRERKELRPIVILPSLKTLNSPLSKDMVLALKSSIIEGLPQNYWIKMDAKKIPYSNILSKLGLSGSRSKIIGASQPFVHSGVNVMVLRMRLSGEVSYPLKSYKGDHHILSSVDVKDILSKYKISQSNIDVFIKKLPHLSPCYSDAYFTSMLSEIFKNIRKLRLSQDKSCELMRELLSSVTLCNRTIQKTDLPVPPPPDTKIMSHDPMPGMKIWYREEEYVVVNADADAGLLMIIPESGYIKDRILIPHSYAYVSNKKTDIKVLLPGVCTSEYLTVSKLTRTIAKKGSKETVDIKLDDITTMERSVLLVNNSPSWKGKDCELNWKKNKWILNHNDVEYVRILKNSKWEGGWCGEYKNGESSILISERHGSMFDGAKRYISENNDIADIYTNIAFSGRPEHTGEYREYTCMRLGILACLAKSKHHRVQFVTLGESGSGSDPQNAWLSHLNGFVGVKNGLRYLSDDIGIAELYAEYKKIPMIKFHSLTNTPVYTSLDEKDYSPTITNPESKMSQFVTFVSDLEQLYSLGWKVWAKGGPPLYRPPNKASGIASVVGSAKEIIKRANVDMYKNITPDAIAWAIKYGFHKLRSCAFISIRSNAIQTFIPMVKLGYKNTYPRDDSFWFGEGVTEKKYLSIKNKVLREMGMSTEIFSPRSTWFANNSLIGNMKSDSINDVFTLIAFHMLQETLRTQSVGDCDFILNVRDFPKLRYDGRDPDHAVHGVLANGESAIMDGYDKPDGKTIPFVGFNTHPDYADIPIVDPDTWVSSYGGYFGTKEGGGPVQSNEWVVKKDIWKKRIPKAVFRGSATGYGSGSDDNQRLHIAEMFPEDDTHVDCAITSGAVRDRKTDSRGMRYIVPTNIADKVPEAVATTHAVIDKKARLPVSSKEDEFMDSGVLKGQDKYRMVLYIDGNAGAYRYTSLMRSGFCILKLDSLIGYEMWMYPSLKEALPGSNTAKFLDLTNDEITALFKEGGDHIKVDTEGRNIRKIVEWSKSSPVAVEITRQIAENAIKQYNTMCNPKVLTALTALTLNTLSKEQTWTVSHAATKRDITEPSVVRDIIRTMDRIKKSERETESILIKMEKDSSDVIETEILERFTRPKVSTDASVRTESEGLKTKGRLDIVNKDLDKTVIPDNTKKSTKRGYIPTLKLKKGPHKAIGFIMSKADTSSLATDTDGGLKELI